MTQKETRLVEHGDEFERLLLSAGRSERMSPAARAALRTAADAAATGLVAACAAAAAKAIAKSSGIALWMKCVGLLVVASAVATAVVRTRTIASVDPATPEQTRPARVSVPGPTRAARAVASGSSSDELGHPTATPAVEVLAIASAEPTIRRPASVPLPAARPRSSTLADEARLIEAARSASRRGEPAEALRWLDEHAAAFTAGALREEATVIRAEVLASIDPAAGRDLAARYLREHPESPYRGRLAPLTEGP